MRATTYGALTAFAIAGLAGFASSNAEPAPCDSSRVPCRSATVTRAAPTPVTPRAPVAVAPVAPTPLPSSPVPYVGPWLFVSAVPGGRAPAASTPVVLLREDAAAAPSFAAPDPAVGSGPAPRATPSADDRPTPAVFIANAAPIQGTEVVFAMQNLLATLGYEPGRPTGVVTPKTREAIRCFQTDAGLLPDGQPSGTVLILLTDRVAKKSGPGASGNR